MLMPDDGYDVLDAIAAAGAVLFGGTVVAVVLVQLIAPAFGVTVGSPPDTVIGTLVVAFLVLVGAVSGAVFDRWRK